MDDPTETTAKPGRERNGDAPGSWSLKQPDISPHQHLWRLTTICTLVLLCAGLTYYSHAVLRLTSPFPHLFYIPSLLAAFWWGRKGIVVPVVLAVMLLASHAFVLPEPITYDDYLRSLLIVVITYVVAVMTDRLTEQKTRALREKAEASLARMEQKLATQRLEESEQRLRTLVEILPHKVFLKDTESNYMLCNANYARDIGVSPGGIRGQSDFDFHPRELAEKYRADDQRVIASGEAEEIEEKYIQGGDELWIQTLKAPLRDADGRVMGVLGVFWDITEKKLAEQKLRETLEDLARSNQELEQFAYVASHDLQEPLRMVASYTQLLERRYKDQLDETANEFIGYAVEGSNRMQRLIQDLLAYSRVTTRGKEFAEANLEEVLAEAKANLQAATEETGAEITHDPLPVVKADYPQMVQLVQNLVGNAVKFYSEEPPRVHVTAEEKPTEWVVSVKDNGIGIDPQYFDRVFVVFQRLHGREKYPGTGIGLALCRRIVHRHGGNIWIESEPGNGSTFFFSIPKREAG